MTATATAVVAPSTSTGRTRLARLAGALYLALAVAGMFAVSTVDGLLAPGDAAATAENLAGSQPLLTAALAGWVVVVLIDAALSVLLLVLLRPSSNRGAWVVAGLRLAYTATLVVLLRHLVDAGALAAAAHDGWQGEALSALEAFDRGFALALVLFGAHLVALGVVLRRAGAVPQLLAVALVAGGLGYAADSLSTVFLDGHPAVVSAVLLAPAVVGELWLTGWLLVRGLPLARGR